MKRNGHNDKERRVPPPFRDLVLSEHERLLVTTIVGEMKKHLGITSYEEHREDQRLMKQLLPTMEIIEKKYQAQADFWAWWKSTAGKWLAMLLTGLVGLALLLGANAAIGVMFERLTKP